MTTLATMPRTGVAAAATSLIALTERLGGRIVTPADGHWDTARQAWNLAIDQRPEFIVEVANAADVSLVIRFAAQHGLRVAPQGTGHNASPLGDLTGTVLMRTTRMRTITVDAEARTVRVEAGVEWGEVAAALAPYGLTALAGSSPDVGVLGYTLGGGYSWLSRKHGLASSRVTAIELVTGDGVFRRVSAQHDPSVFWAVRGGGANFGVVCALEFEVLPMTEVYAGSLFFPIERGPELFRAHARWSRTAPDAATTAIRLLRIPDLPELPDFLRGQSFAMVTGAVDAPAADAEAILAPLRALGPIIDTFANMPTAALSSIMMDPPQPTPGRGDGLIIDELTDEAIDAIMAVAGPGQQTPLVAVDLRHLEGAVGRPDPRGGVVNHFPGRYLAFAIGVVAVPELAALIEGDLHRLRDGLAPWTSSRDYSNFREVATSARRFYADEDYDRLLRLRTICDPRQILRSNHELS